MKNLFFVAILFILTIGYYGCSDDYESTNVVGKWKLEKAETVFYNPQLYNYSQNNIIYEFKSNGILIISSDIDDYIGDMPGEYTYDSVSAKNENEPNTLIFNDSSWWYSISEKEMILDNSPLDGPILYFVRI